MEKESQGNAATPRRLRIAPDDLIAMGQRGPRGGAEYMILHRPTGWSVIVSAEYPVDRPLKADPLQNWPDEPAMELRIPLEDIPADLRAAALDFLERAEQLAARRERNGE